MSTQSSSLPLSTYSLEDLLRFNEAVYGTANRRDFNLLMDSRLSEYASRVLLWVRKKETERIGYHLSMLLSWLLAIANKLGLLMHKEVTLYCATGLPVTAPLAELQNLFVKRHAKATLPDASLCFAEKVLALVSAHGKYQTTHQAEHLALVAKRLAQSFEALCVVSSLLGFQLNVEFGKHFENGCHTCWSIPCKGEFELNKVV